MRHLYRSSYRLLITYLIILMLAALHNLRITSAQSLNPLQVPIIPSLDDLTIATLRTIFNAGQAKGNRAEVFAKIGDSITESQSFLSGFGCHEDVFDTKTEHLAEVITYFSKTTFPASYASSWCEVANSFTRNSVSAMTGWSADYSLVLLDPPVEDCPSPYNTPLRCELHLLKPAFALIMYGTNDLERYNNLAMFRENINQIIYETINAGVVPILYTIPPRLDRAILGERVAPHNAVILNAAQAHHIPVINYWAALTAPGIIDQGLSEDGAHPNLYGNCAPECRGFDLTAEGLRYGYNQRNLITLETLALLKTVLIDNADKAGDVPAADSTETALSLQEDTILVSQSGTDSDSCGTKADPCQTIKRGIAQAKGGQTVLVQPGTYAENCLEMKSGLTLRSRNGADSTKIYSGALSAVRFDSVQDATLDGFEIYGDWNAGDPGDGLVRVMNASNITIRNAVIHDAPFDQDVIKVSDRVSGLLIENVVAYNPGQREARSDECKNTICYQEVIDLYGSGAQAGDPVPLSDVIVRGCWLFHTPQIGGDWLIYTKINAENILYENNVFGPSAGMGAGNAAVGIGTGEAGEPDASAYVVHHAIVRRNVFMGLKGDAAFAIMNANDVWVYNNLFYGNSGSDLRSVIMFRGNTRPVGKVVMQYNTFYANQPEAKDSRLYWIRDSEPQPFERSYNHYVSNTYRTDVDYRSEEHAVFGSSLSLNPAAIPNISTPTISEAQKIKVHFASILSTEAHLAARRDYPNWKPGVTDR